MKRQKELLTKNETIDYLNLDLTTGYGSPGKERETLCFNDEHDASPPLTRPLSTILR